MDDPNIPASQPVMTPADDASAMPTTPNPMPTEPLATPPAEPVEAPAEAAPVMPEPAAPVAPADPAPAAPEAPAEDVNAPVPPTDAV